jgi:hypothetical protein
MQPHHDDASFAWIRHAKIPFKSKKDIDWRGDFVSNVLPQSFETYVKILHRIDAHYENVDNPLAPSEIAILKIPPCEKLRSFVVSLRDQSLGTRVRWRILAEKLSVPFAPEINAGWYRTKLEVSCWPRFLSGPSDACLRQECLNELVSVLKGFTGDGGCFFQFSRWQFPREENPRLFGGTLEELEGFLQGGRYRVGPEYWWPGERTWCICSNYDFQFTLVGCSKQLGAVLMANPVLECIEVRPQTRIDYSAPIPTISE